MDGRPTAAPSGDSRPLERDGTPRVRLDRDGRWTGSRQTIKAITSTLEYRIPYGWTNTIVRLEHRYDNAPGSGGGFFQGSASTLTPGQNLLAVALIVTLDSPTQR